MTKNFLSWMASGLAGIAVSVYTYFTSGHELSLKSVLSFVASAVLVRAAQWVVANLGPKPVE